MRVLVILALQYVSVCILNLPWHVLHRPDGTLRARFFGLQGGGLYIYDTATLTNTNVYSNTASQVRARLSNLPRRFLHRGPLN